MTSIQANPADHADDDDHGHDHDPNLAHHFESMEQQMDSGKLGMWLFLATEVLFFGGLFAAYAVLRARNPEVFSYASQYLDTLMGGINTCVLIASSLTMALAVRYAQTGKKWPLVFCLWLTMGGAVGFLVIKYFEYSSKIGHGLLPGTAFSDAHFLAAHPEIQNPHHFFGIYFCMTGLHGFHVICGIAYLGFLLLRTIQGRFDNQYYAPVEMGGLYWHLVDLIWIFLFPLLYLIG